MGSNGPGVNHLLIEADGAYAFESNRMIEFVQHSMDSFYSIFFQIGFVKLSPHSATVSMACYL